jgi:hypothetical protein
MPNPVRKQNASDTGATIKRPSVIDRIRPIGFEEDEGIKVLVWGESGSGKTTFWSTFPRPILCIVVSGGNKSGEARSIDTAENRKVISAVSLDHTDEAIDLTTYAAQTGLFKTVVIDHVTGFQDKVLSQITGKPIPEQKTWGTASQQQYGQATSQCKDLFRGILNLPINVVFVGQERVNKGVANDEDSESIKPTVGVNLMPQLAGWVNCAVDYIVQTFKRNKTEKRMIGVGKTQVEQIVTLRQIEYCLRTGPDSTYTTKFRVPKGHYLPDTVPDPSYDKLVSIIDGTYKTKYEAKPTPRPVVAKPGGVRPGVRPGAT